MLRYSFEFKAAISLALALSASCSQTDSQEGGAQTGGAGSPVLVPATTSVAPQTPRAPVLTAAQPFAGSASSAGDVVVPELPSPLPCDIGKVVSAKCGACHGSSPVGGAPMSLVTQADFSAMLKSLRTLPGETKSVAELVKMRINDDAKPMPPGAKLEANDLAAFNAWLDRGHPGGLAADAACAQPAMPVDEVASKPGIRPDGTTCYEFRNHGQPNPGDTSPYSVIPGEHYVSFYYNTPWTEPVELVNWRTIYDNRKVMHHWLLYSTLGNTMDGTFLPSVGTHIGDAANLIAGWAVGGNDVAMPPDVGLQLPPPGSGLLLEWHFYNSDAAPQMDSSAIEVCTLPAGTMKNTAGMTWLGTEDFNGPLGMPPKVESQFTGTCIPSRVGMNNSDPIHIFTLWPHMHTYGRHMQSSVVRANGTIENVFDKPFDFNYQITYESGIDLFPGDMISSTCTFNNTSDFSVAFGPSTEQEMCYQFAFSYPAGALQNGVPSLVGATNTCW
jgi:hypothetical protein